MAPTGPSTSAPDKAPSAASPARSWAIAAEEISAKEIVTIAIVFFIQDPPDGCATMFPLAQHGTIDGVLTRCLGCHTPTAFVRSSFQAAAPIDRPAFAYVAKYRAAHQRRPIFDRI
jgi:hypothetical protein